MDSYIAFISYSRKDKDIATWLHAKLEKYVLPRKTNTNQIFQFETKYFRPVFIDIKDLHVEERPFSEGIKKALENSEFLIVICSKNSAKSPYVKKEIEYFLSTHNNNTTRIVPLFIDDVDGAIPPSFDGTSIMNRHFPIYNSKLSKNSEANVYCLLQIISYILGISFSSIYNRYEIESQKQIKKRIKILTIIVSSLIAVIVVICLLSFNIIEHKNNLIEFEKKVFPQAVVHGYEKNFLTPVIRYLKGEPRKFIIYILMPRSERDLTHQNRIEDFEFEAKINLGIDSLPSVNLPTESKRGSKINQIVKNGKFIDGIYIDFASTTTTFLDIARFKRKNRNYKQMPTDSIINEYAIEFASQTNEKLESDSVYIKFFFDKNDLIEELHHKLDNQ